MQIAALLSDLKSLSACDHESALALVTVHQHQQERPSQPDAAAAAPSTSTASPSRDKKTNPDLDRAKDLIALHYSVNSSSLETIDAGLRQARADVNGVLVALYRKSRRT